MCGSTCNAHWFRRVALSYYITVRISFTSILYLQCTHMIFIIYTCTHNKNLLQQRRSMKFNSELISLIMKVTWAAAQLMQYCGTCLQVPYGITYLGGRNKACILVRSHYNTDLNQAVEQFTGRFWDHRGQVLTKKNRKQKLVTVCANC